MAFITVWFVQERKCSTSLLLEGIELQMNSRRNTKNKNLLNGTLYIKCLLNVFVVSLLHVDEHSEINVDETMCYRLEDHWCYFTGMRLCLHAEYQCTHHNMRGTLKSPTLTSNELQWVNIATYNLNCINIAMQFKFIGNCYQSYYYRYIYSCSMLAMFHGSNLNQSYIAKCITLQCKYIYDKVLAT